MDSPIKYDLGFFDAHNSIVLGCEKGIIEYEQVHISR